MRAYPRCAHVQWERRHQSTSWTCACWGGPNVEEHVYGLDLELLRLAYREGGPVTLETPYGRTTVTPYDVGTSCRKDRAEDLRREEVKWQRRMESIVTSDSIDL